MMRQAVAAVPAGEPAVTGAVLRQFMRSWPTGVAVVTSSLPSAPRGGASRPAAPLPVGCTVNSFVSVSLRPPLLLISLSRRSRTLAAILAAGVFGVNVLAGPQHHLAEHFATTPDDARFRHVRYEWRRGVPALDSAAAMVVCAVDRAIEAADHVLVLGIPQWCDCDDRLDPLVFAAGAYHAMGGCGDSRQRGP